MKLKCIVGLHSYKYSPYFEHAKTLYWPYSRMERVVVERKCEHCSYKPEPLSYKVW